MTAHVKKSEMGDLSNFETGQKSIKLRLVLFTSVEDFEHVCTSVLVQVSVHVFMGYQLECSFIVLLQYGCRPPHQLTLFHHTRTFRC